MQLFFFLTFDRREYETCFFDKIIQKNLLSIQKNVVTLQKVSGIGHVSQCRQLIKYKSVNQYNVMRKAFFSVMAFVVAMLVWSCSKDEQSSEVAMTISDVTDSTAVVKCEYSPAKSATYTLRILESVSDECSESLEFNVTNLRPGTKYDVVATSYDADHKEVGSTVMNFMTSGEPDNFTVWGGCDGGGQGVDTTYTGGGSDGDEHNNNNGNNHPIINPNKIG